MPCCNHRVTPPSSNDSWHMLRQPSLPPPRSPHPYPKTQSAGESRYGWGREVFGKSVSAKPRCSLINFTSCKRFLSSGHSLKVNGHCAVASTIKDLNDPDLASLYPFCIRNTWCTFSTFQNMRREISKAEDFMSLITTYCGHAARTSVMFEKECSHSITYTHVPLRSHFQEFARVPTVGDELFTCRSVACEAIRVIVFKWQNLTPHRIRQVCFVLSLSRTTCFDPYPPAWKKRGVSVIEKGWTAQCTGAH